MIVTMDVRDAGQLDLDALAEIWHSGWHEAHAPIVPAVLTGLRTRDSFRERLEHALPTVRTVGPTGQPAGFSMVKDAELYQLYVASSARGSGAAAALIADAERRLAEAGVATAWLACAIGNDRAARFYQKNGWRLAGTLKYVAETSEGPFPLDVWRYEKELVGNAGAAGRGDTRRAPQS